MSLQPILMSDDELFNPQTLTEQLSDQLEKIKFGKITDDSPISKEELEKTKKLAISLIEMTEHTFVELKRAVELLDTTNPDSFIHFEKVLEKI